MVSVLPYFTVNKLCRSSTFEVRKSLIWDTTCCESLESDSLYKEFFPIIDDCFRFFKCDKSCWCIHNSCES
ncbi:Hypothetical predicted protein [Octopus vulgaris]|uniref:Uncharacterized protein n=1 Tax=Octopus vulgaris TaxID=6645 RepID=A0AA36ANP9_OCTVU|nr:Hypothetical predicted protein [Octopus vulgaris]